MRRVWDCATESLLRVVQKKMLGSRMKLNWVLLLFSLLFAHQAESALHKCVDANGKTLYSDVPCPEEQAAEVKPMPGGVNALAVEGAVEGLPGIHPTWMQTPAYLQDPVRCVDRLCTCGKWEFSQSEKEDQRLLSALNSLPNHWRSYELSSREFNQREWSGGKPRSTDGLRRAACEIRVEQKILVDLYPKLVPQMVDEHARNLEWLQRISERCRQPDSGRSTETNAAWAAYERCRNEARAEQSKANQKLNQTRRTDDRLREALAELELPRPSISR